MLFVWTLNKHVYTSFAYSYFLGAENLQSFIYLVFLICMVTIKINKYIFFLLSRAETLPDKFYHIANVL